MGYMVKCDHINTCSISRMTRKWMKKLFFHSLDLSILNSFILITSCCSKRMHRYFRYMLFRKLSGRRRGGGGLDFKPYNERQKPFLLTNPT
jgi:hypothetical protein